MVTTNDLRRGMVIKLDGELYTVVDQNHHKPGKGGAIVRTKLRNVKKGTVKDMTFRPSEKVEDVRLDQRPMQYLYEEGDHLVFMDTETYEQESIPTDAIGDAASFLKPEDICEIAIYEGKPITVTPPSTVVLKVTYAEPGAKGDTATNVTKPVKVETGAEVKVPLFINEGDYIKVSTETGAYMERVKK
ncbi:MAG TPA: elongation factor P [Spirochaetota bacterium]|nr:elongation factor P [Spirochaetota bacterium]HNT09352.1 elongation factor P [Spirochaetota bacterium]HNV47456.1 elongation factor P [Spirochaetota bacterium]HOS40775.1 elongation factor P [Spirochaetota bacterium]HPI21638.1 elongation factor P [Spirochaetota bacterium]